MWPYTNPLMQCLLEKKILSFYIQYIYLETLGSSLASKKTAEKPLPETVEFYPPLIPDPFLLREWFVTSKQLQLCCLFIFCLQLYYLTFLCTETRKLLCAHSPSLSLALWIALLLLLCIYTPPISALSAFFCSPVYYFKFLIHSVNQVCSKTDLSFVSWITSVGVKLLLPKVVFPLPQSYFEAWVHFL